jgi:hypothetical protein
VLHTTDPAVEPHRRILLPIAAIAGVEPIADAYKYPGARALVRTRGVFEEIYAVAESLAAIAEQARAAVFLDAAAG